MSFSQLACSSPGFLISAKPSAQPFCSHKAEALPPSPAPNPHPSPRQPYLSANPVYSICKVNPESDHFCPWSMLAPSVACVIIVISWLISPSAFSHALLSRSWSPTRMPNWAAHPSPTALWLISDSGPPFLEWQTCANLRAFTLTCSWLGMLFHPWAQVPPALQVFTEMSPYRWGLPWPWYLEIAHVAPPCMPPTHTSCFSFLLYLSYFPLALTTFPHAVYSTYWSLKARFLSLPPTSLYRKCLVEFLVQKSSQKYLLTGWENKRMNEQILCILGSE